jgi:hypothetical protein
MPKRKREDGDDGHTPCCKSEFDVFSQPLMSHDVASARYEEIGPTTSLTNSQLIELEVKGSVDECLSGERR